jgi:hypothetical protein
MASTLALGCQLELDTSIPGACGMRLKETNDNPYEIHNVASTGPGALPPYVVDVNFLITSTELRDRKAKRRRKHSRSRSNGLVELGLKAKK